MATRKGTAAGNSVATEPDELKEGLGPILDYLRGVLADWSVTGKKRPGPHGVEKRLAELRFDWVMYWLDDQGRGDVAENLKRYKERFLESYAKANSYARDVMMTERAAVGVLEDATAPALAELIEFYNVQQPGADREAIGDSALDRLEDNGAKLETMLRSLVEYLGFSINRPERNEVNARAAEKRRKNKRPFPRDNDVRKLVEALAADRKKPESERTANDVKLTMDLFACSRDEAKNKMRGASNWRHLYEQTANGKTTEQ